MELIPVSGDLLSEGDWQERIRWLKKDYCPAGKNGAIILMMRMGMPIPGPGQDVVVAALSVESCGFYCTTLIGGNHDMLPGELKITLRKIKQSRLATIFGTWPGHESEAEVREALEKLS
jgi:hypothetical protein